jgi:3-methylcrotonyl-CoA carboxylase alpha subunit
VAGRLIRSVLVPNRGEIAVRIARCCRELGIHSVLAAADDDLGSHPARFFDEVVSLGSGDARQTYLNVGPIIDAARSTGADAIHPGYGFLSERPALAAACEDAGIVFIGPKAATIERMGSKSESRRLMERAGVPVVPGYDGEDQSDSTLATEASRIGFPLLIKPSSGGGGKGMKIARRSEELSGAVQSSRREALSAFGDDRILLERFVKEPRHVEFQVFGDGEGNVVQLYERDCSVQRRHQKVIEESPAPRYSEGLRSRMGDAAVAAARAVGYRNAGTVEFLLTPEGEFYFLEMNTRIQVEHPLTELVLDVDLVGAQFGVAAGGRMPWSQEQLRQRGHAIECRVYAEDPDEGFLPQAGTILAYAEPAGPGIRIDSGVAQGSEVLVKYDPLLAKLIAWGEDRESCLRRLVRALGEFVILGTATNLSFMRRVIRHRAFREASYSTAFLDEQAAELRRGPGEAVAIAAVLASVQQPASRALARSRTPGVWETVGRWGW